MKTSLMAGAALAAVALVGAGGAFAQSAPGYSVPHLKDGRPDLQGFWNNTSITSLQRPGGVKSLVVTEDEAKKIVNRNVLVVLSKQDQATNGEDPNNTKVLEDKNADRGYNAYWIDPGKSLAMVRDEYRSSWITDPPSGRIPYKADAARKGGFAAANFDGPETRPLAERCLMSFSGSAGPVMQNGMYNNTFQIVQAPHAVMIEVEMAHEARIIPIVAGPADAAKAHNPAVIPKWAGDSVGWYEGDTLVVETVNPNPIQRGLITDQGKLIERFSRWNEKQVLYQFEVTDPDALFPDVEGRGIV